MLKKVNVSSFTDVITQTCPGRKNKHFILGTNFTICNKSLTLHWCCKKSQGLNKLTRGLWEPCMSELHDLKVSQQLFWLCILCRKKNDELCIH